MLDNLQLAQPRLSSGKDATVQLPDNRPVRRGIRILAASGRVTNRFTLILSDSRRECRVIWRTDKQVGRRSSTKRLFRKSHDQPCNSSSTRLFANARPPPLVYRAEPLPVTTQGRAMNMAQSRPIVRATDRRSGEHRCARHQPTGFQSARINYERYLTLALAEVQNGNTIAAENDTSTPNTISD